MDSSNVLYCESWDVTKRFNRNHKDDVPMKYTLTISETQEGHKVQIVQSYPPYEHGKSRFAHFSCHDWDKCVEYALETMYCTKKAVGLWDTGLTTIDYSDQEAESIIHNFTGVSQKEASHICRDEVDTLMKHKMSELSKEGASDGVWVLLVECVNKKVSCVLYSEHKHRMTKRRTED